MKNRQNQARAAAAAGSSVRLRFAGVDTGPTAETVIGSKIEPQPNGCWLYRGEAGQYGKTSAGGSMVAVHRYVYETLVGEIPEGHHIHHHCLTPGCCNPEHLEAVTPEDHVGIHRGCGLSRGDLAEMDSLARQGMTIRKLAERFAVSPSSTHRLLAKYRNE